MTTNDHSMDGARVRPGRRFRRPVMAAVGTLGLVAVSGAGVHGASAASAAQSSVKHVLLISVDGLHASDLAQCEASHLCPNLAALAGGGTTYTDAHTSEPSDSSPGENALVSGADPKLAGIYYDDSYDRTMYQPAAQTATSTQDCSGAPGAETMYAENIDLNAPSTANGQVGTRPIMNAAIDSTQLPYLVQNGVCSPVQPNDFNRANTVFSVASAAGLHTAWADKHPSANALAAGHGTPNAVGDPFQTEINADLIPASLVDTRGTTITFPLPNPDGTGPYFITDKVGNTEAYDHIKVDAILNEIDGETSGGTPGAGEPAIFGMNFQTVSVGEKLVDPQLSCARSGGAAGCDPNYIPGGYVPGTLRFTPQLRGAVQFVDASLGAMVSELRSHHELGSTEIIISAKHGQSPIDPSKLALIGHAEDTVLSKAGINVAQTTDDDVALIWLADQSQTAAAVAALNSSITNGNPAHIQYVLSGAALAARFNDPAVDPRTPDIIIQPIPGTIYSHSAAKVAEHGGFSEDDTHVAMIVTDGASLAGGNQQGPGVVTSPVTTAQVAPTILSALGLDPGKLDSVSQEHVRVLPTGDAQ